MNKNIKRIIFLILIVINCIVIFSFSSDVSEKSSNKSGRVVSFISQIIPNIRNMGEQEKIEFQDKVLTPIVRKTAHFSIYTLLGILVMNLCITYKGTYYQKGLVSLVIGMIYALSDEFHQLFVPGRSGEIRDVMIDTLGVLTGIVLVYIITKIYRKITNKDKQKKENISKDTKIMFISSTGGHFSELMQLKSLFDECNYSIVTERTETNKNLKDKYNDKMNFLLYGTKRNLFKYAFILLFNCFKSLYLYLKIRPQIVITTGTHTAGPMCCIARILGSKVIYIETFANRTTKTATGKLLYFIANIFIVQWEEMIKLYPKAKYFGWIY